ncbi:transposase [Acetobacter malorum]|uniref:Transposase n=1 Tax=Acetobacter malorum TaxID=178901 RepID=A0A177G5U1_9PROT|nr:transposase [Acetobacter malorum]OAG75564.1 transposase [Acetobacter malorum]OAG75710.1 transposase [Acetobacter malorum]
MLDEVDPETFIADRPYDADPLIKKRNIIERFFTRLKQLRGIATRYNMQKSTFCAAVQILFVVIGVD